MFENDPKPPALFQDLVITVEGRPPSLNARRHWRAIAADNKRWKADVENVALEARQAWERKHGLRWKPVRTCILDVLFVVKDRRARDWDNLISTMKPEIDGLVSAGIILDDSSEVIQKITFEIEYEKGETKTRFSIRELDA